MNDDGRLCAVRYGVLHEIVEAIQARLLPELLVGCGDDFDDGLDIEVYDAFITLDAAIDPELRR